MRADRGLTLFEIIVASVIGLIVLIQLGQLQGSQMRYSLGIQQQSMGSTDAMLAINSLLNKLAQADRIVLVSTGTATNPSNGDAKIKLRYFPSPPAGAPTAAFYDTGANYRWAQYSLDAANKQVKFYDNIGAGCGATSGTWSDITALTIEPDDGGPAPPGGEPALADNNLLALRIQSKNTSKWYHGEMTLGGVAYTNLTSNCPGGGPCDSGVGLDVGGASGAVPASCSP